MADRKRSTDGSRETEEVLGEKPENLEEAPSVVSRKWWKFSGGVIRAG